MTRRSSLMWGAFIALALIGGSLVAPPGPVRHAMLIGSAYNG